MRKCWWVFVLLIFGAVSMASSKKGTAVFLSFHLETSKDDWPKNAQAVKMGDPAQQYYFKLSPVITDGEVKWFSPFISQDGVTYGCAFKLSQHGTNILQQVTSAPENHGKLLASNMQPLDADSGPLRSYVQIDRRVDDGILVVWDGFTDRHLRLFAERFPHARDVEAR
ncbi:MAG: hypothetical protein DVB23_001748 [Verrucomicrobia bacterium]|jgi:hypothetical protein|nr:MAG: hypothetical protein DVB23_001748 [Verrucomicrobiota bacterium]